MGSCPLTGEVAEVTETAGRVVVRHAKLGRFSLEPLALPVIAGDLGVGERLASWIAEARSLRLSIPHLTTEHVDLFGRLADLDAAASEWAERRESMSRTDYEALWTKLRLEWNYNSNHIEGNTLTYSETELLLIHGRTRGGHPMRDYEEMKAHDVAIDHAQRLAGEERVLGEGDIRDLNKILLKEPFWQRAETQDGQSTQVRIVPGEYKTRPNHVRTPTGELHRFAEPEETPALMDRWTREFQRNLERSAYPLPLFLAESHWSFLRIHPFGDGNGRTARLLANYALLRRGLPPIVIKTAERDRYIGALQNADVGYMMPLARFLLENVLWVLELGIRAAKGETIRKADDVDKEIDVFVRRHRASPPSPSDVEVLDNVFHRWIRPTLDGVETRIKPLQQLFRANNRGSRIKLARDPVGYGENVFGREGWEQAKQKYILKPGFGITDQVPLELQRIFRFQVYTGCGNGGFSVILCLAWILDGEGVSFSAKIDGKPTASSVHRVRYAELETCDPEADRTANVISQAMMNEIARRSGERD